MVAGGGVVFFLPPWLLPSLLSCVQVHKVDDGDPAGRAGPDAWASFHSACSYGGGLGASS